MIPTQERQLKSRVIGTRHVAWKEFKYIQQETFKALPADAKQKLKASILQNEFSQPFYVWQDPATKDIYCLDGKHRTGIMLELIGEGVKIPEVLPATFIECENKKDAAALVLVYSSIYAKTTEQGVFDFVKMYDLEWQELNDTIDLPGLDFIEIERMFQPAGNGNGGESAKRPSLVDRFIVPPFSILDSRQGYWQERKKQWHELGIDSQETRKDFDIISQSGQSTAIYELRNKMRDVLKREPDWDEIIDYAKQKGLHVFEGASVFDPVLCEIIYKWFLPTGGTVLDPFAGGSVRGIVAGLMSHQYHGIDLRADQVEANRKQAEAVMMSKQLLPQWYVGDSNQELDAFPNDFCDLVFSCPPYHDLEQYSDDPCDLSNMSYESFKGIYRSIISKSVATLKQNRFACFVVSEIRDKKGYYKHFVRETISAFEDAGCMLYNDIVLINVAGSLPIRIGRQFQGFRKVGKSHQNVLVFYKGDIKRIPEEFPEIEVPDPEAKPAEVEQL